MDFFHASEHLQAAVAAAYGDGTHETRFRYETLRGHCATKRNGVDKVIRALKHLSSKVTVTEWTPSCDDADRAMLAACLSVMTANSGSALSTRLPRSSTRRERRRSVSVDTKGSFEALDAWIPRKLRAILWRQWKRPGTRLKKLRQGGVDVGRAGCGPPTDHAARRFRGGAHVTFAT